MPKVIVDGTRYERSGCLQRRIQALRMEIAVDDMTLGGILEIPDDARAIIVFVFVFVHGSGRSRFSPRNRRVAMGLQHARFATLQLDLLTLGEQRHDDIDAMHRLWRVRGSRSRNLVRSTK